MKKRPEFLLGGFAVLVVLAIILSGRFSEANEVKSVVQEQLRMWNDGDVDGLYATLTPTAQQICSIDVAKALARGAGSGSEVAIKSMAIKVEGDRATVTGFVTLNGGLVGQIDPSDPAVYVKTDSGWKLDSLERARSACQLATATAGL